MSEPLYLAFRIQNTASMIYCFLSTENIIFGLIRSHPKVKTVGFPAHLNCKLADYLTQHAAQRLGCTPQKLITYGESIQIARAEIGFSDTANRDIETA